MPTIKKRLNISLSPEAERLLTLASQRDNVPEATKASALLNLALEIEEDDALEQFAKSRDTKSATFVSHLDAWK
jgi:hypothetical protein